jgi:hypothetical protein
LSGQWEEHRHDRKRKIDRLISFWIHPHDFEYLTRTVQAATPSPLVPWSGQITLYKSSFVRRGELVPRDVHSAQVAYRLNRCNPGSADHVGDPDVVGDDALLGLAAVAKILSESLASGQLPEQ